MLQKNTLSRVSTMFLNQLCSAHLMVDLMHLMETEISIRNTHAPQSPLGSLPFVFRSAKIVDTRLYNTPLIESEVTKALTLGSPRSAMAMLSFLFCPPDRCFAKTSICSSSPTSVNDLCSCSDLLLLGTP